MLPPAAEAVAVAMQERADIARRTGRGRTARRVEADAEQGRRRLEHAVLFFGER
jgi:hypothetical protein